jgi:NADPH:quinone reductase-like Zn-dependent oxidoreductase
MRSVRFDQVGEPAEVLRVEEVPRPEPGPGQALVRLRARPINPSDLYFIRGLYGLQRCKSPGCAASKRSTSCAGASRSQNSKTSARTR